MSKIFPKNCIKVCHEKVIIFLRKLTLLLLLSLFSHVWLCDPIDGSPRGSPVPGILQARTLEWVAISFSNAWKGKVKVKSLSCVQLLATPWTTAHQALSMGFSRQEYLSGVPLLSLKTNSSIFLNYEGYHLSKRVYLTFRLSLKTNKKHLYIYYPSFK